MTIFLSYCLVSLVGVISLLLLISTCKQINEDKRNGDL